MNKVQLLELRKKSHHLKPVILIGQKGLTDAVMNEIDLALDAHECIKIRISGVEKPERQIMINQILNKLGTQLIDTIGHMLVIYRKNEQS